MRHQAVRKEQTRWLFNFNQNSLFVLEQTTSTAGAKERGHFLTARSHSSSAEEESPPASASLITATFGAGVQPS
jgi:hypothetical protein